MVENKENLHMPEGWRLVSLAQIAEVVPSNVDKKIYPNEVPVFLCNYMDVYSNDYLSTRINYSQGSVSLSEYQKFRLKKGDVIITKDSETPDDIAVPAVVIEDLEKIVCGYHLALIRPKSDVDGAFLCKAIQTHSCRRHFGNSANGATRYGLAFKVIDSCPIMLPPKTEQIIIAEIILTIDQAIEKTEQLIAKYKRIKTGLMQDLLTRGIDEEGNIRSEETHEFKDSLLGRVPKEWEVGRLIDYCKTGKGNIQTGPFGSQLHAEDYVQEGMPIITVEHLIDEKIAHENLPLVGKSDYNRLIKYNLLTGDLVFSRVGSIDRCSIVSRTENGWLFSGRCLRVRPGNLFLSDYLLFQLNSYPSRKWILNNAVGSTMLCLNTTILSNLPVLKPSIEEQQRIADILGLISSKIESLFVELKKHQKLKNAIMQDLLIGKVRVDSLIKMTQTI